MCSCLGKNYQWSQVGVSFEEYTCLPVVVSLQAEARNSFTLVARGESELSTRARKAVVLRLEEKLLLQENVAHLRQLLSRLSGTSEAQAHTRTDL